MGERGPLRPGASFQQHQESPIQVLQFERVVPTWHGRSSKVFLNLISGGNCWTVRPTAHNATHRPQSSSAAAATTEQVLAEREPSKA